MPIFWSYAFRPMLLLATAQALLLMPWWLFGWHGVIELPRLAGSPVTWHAHELLFGFAGAAIAGFALTAVATWTQRPPICGRPLQLLAACWLLARIGLCSASATLSTVGAVADVAYWLLLGALLLREVSAARNQRNYKVAGLVCAIAASNIAFYLQADNPEAANRMNRLGLSLIVALLVLIAGRVIPAFTANWLSRRGKVQRPPAAFGHIDLAANLAAAVFALLWLVVEQGPIVAAAGLFASFLQAWRLQRWQGQQTLSDPLVWILHLGFAWLPVALVLLSMAALELLPASAGIHALSSGLVVTMVLAVGSRAALGHTGRPLNSHPLLTAAFVAISITAALRVSAGLWPATPLLLDLAATAWELGMLCFGLRYWPILTGPALRVS